MTFVISGLTPPLPPPILKKDDELFFIFFLVLYHIWVPFDKKIFLPPEKCKHFKICKILAKMPENG